jgi:hypothetical protein
MEAPFVEFVKFIPNERAHDAPLCEEPENRKTSARSRDVYIYHNILSVVKIELQYVVEIQ